MSEVLNKTLVALVADTAKIESALIESGGELTPELEEALAVTGVQLPAKIDSYAAIMDRMEAIATHYKQRSDAFKIMERAAHSVIKRLESNLKAAMEMSGSAELTGVDDRFVLQNSPPSVVIESEDRIDGAYKVTETIVKIEKKRILEDLKAGVPVVGAKLERGTHIRRYANTPSNRKKAAQ